MLSILIPTFNYDVYPLVSILKQQADSLRINYEILVQDDASQKFLHENSKINSLAHCNFSINTKNFGRGKNINLLAKKAKFEWLLIMDCDTIPTQDNFIQKYISEIKNEEKIVFGGIEYENKKPAPNQLLRWFYGTAREAISAEKRKINPNGNALTSNLLIRKNIFISNKFDESITKYGYEDLVFLSSLKRKGYIVKHISNASYHLGLETSQEFLNKTKTALENLKSISKNNDLEHSESKIVKIHFFLKRVCLTSFVSFLFLKTEKQIEHNLLSEKPSLFLFDLYKLGYYCSIKS